ncbi:Protein transport protein Sec24C [Asimina triloba]
MASPSPSRAPRPGYPPPNFNPNYQATSDSLAENMQNLQMDRPTGPPLGVGVANQSGPRPSPFATPPPFQSSSPSGSLASSFPGGAPVARPGPPPSGFPRVGPPLTGLQPPNLVSNSASIRPSGPPPFSQPPPVASRPPPPGVFPSPPMTTGPISSAPPPRVYSSSPMTSAPVALPSNLLGPMSNGPPMFTQGPPLAGACAPSVGSFQPPAVGPVPRSSPANIGRFTGIPTFSAPSGIPSQPTPAFPAAVHGIPPTSAPPYAPQPWQMQPHQAQPNQPMPPLPPGMGHPSASGSPMAGPSKIDPNQIPRPIPSSSVAVFETRQQNQANIPPPATSDYIVKDSGNCSPRYMRCTINQIPCSGDLLTTSGFTNDTPRDYYCNTAPDGRRRDADERPELCRGTIEFVATKEYMVRDPMPAVFFFLIDVSMNAIQTGATAAACTAIKQSIDDLPPLMLIVPDVQDVYTPLQTDIIVQLSECRQHLEQLLENIPTMFQNNRVAESAFGAAIEAGYLAMKSTVLPSVGIGSLSTREAEGRTNVIAGEKETHKLLQPADKTLKTMAIEFAEAQVCVDIFLTTQSYIDIASISVVPRTTGGQVYYYHPFSALSDSAKLYNDLRWNITRPQGFEAVMRVRCSQIGKEILKPTIGLQVQDYSGNFCKRIPTDVDLPGIDSDKTIMVTFKHDDKFQEGSECTFQAGTNCALLYTTVYGQRRIRVHTLSLPCTSVLSNLFRTADLDTQFTGFLKQAANEIPTSPLIQVREQITNLCVNILYAYRKFCATVSSSGQLILPEALKLLPLYTLGLRTDGRIDDLSYWVSHVASLLTPLAVPLVYPRMMAIHDLASKETDESLLPPTIPLSSEHVSDDGIFLLENGEDCLIHVGNMVSPDTLRQLFGVPSIEAIPAQFLLEQYDNKLSKKVNHVLNEVRRQRSSYLRYAKISNWKLSD